MNKGISLILFIAFVLSASAGQASSACQALFGLSSVEERLIDELEKTGWSPLEGAGPVGKWNIDGPQDAYYLRELGEALRAANGNARYFTFLTFLENRREAGLSTHLLDLFGSGFHIQPTEVSVMGFDVNSMTGLRYDPFNKADLPPSYPASKVPPEILGDAFHPETWRKLDESMRARGIPKMDLVTMRPYGGWNQPFTKTTRGNALALAYLMKNVVNRLSPTGQFIFSVELIHLEGDISKSREFNLLRKLIERRTPYRLVLLPTLDADGNTSRLSGALYPK
jgi:hypothetical protein